MMIRKGEGGRWEDVATRSKYISQAVDHLSLAEMEVDVIRKLPTMSQGSRRDMKHVRVAQSLIKKSVHTLLKVK